MTTPQIKTKARPLALLTTGVPFPLSQPAAVSATEASVKQSTPSVKTAHTPTFTPTLSEMSSSRTESENENALLAAGILSSVVPTLLAAGLIRKARHSATGDLLLVLPSTVWTDKAVLK